LPGVCKLAGVANRRYQSGCRDWSDTTQLLQAHRHRILSGDLLNFAVEL
jgi:hypothetical protein